jgi:hypothetical protein
MFVVRSLFWLTTLVMLLPPSTDGEPAPRVGLLQSVYAVRILLQDVSGVCARNPQACATSREALALLSDKLETGATIVAAGLAAGRAESRPETADHGTLQPADLEPAWSVADAVR